MSRTNIGGQEIFSNLEEVRGKNLSKFGFSLHPQGIYSSIGINVIDATAGTVVVRQSVGDRWTAVFNNSDAGETTQIVFSEDYRDIVVTETKCYVVLRYAPVAAYGKQNFAEILGVEWATNNTTDASKVMTTDIIIGKCIYEASVLTDGVDYSRQPYIDVPNVFAVDNELYVEATEPPSAAVNVIGGVVYVNGVENYVSSATVTLTSVTAYRNDLFYVNSLGAVSYVSGLDQGSPTMPALPPGTSPIAFVGRTGPTEVVTGNDIHNVPTNKYMTMYSETPTFDEVTVTSAFALTSGGTLSVAGSLGTTATITIASITHLHVQNGVIVDFT